MRKTLVVISSLVVSLALSACDDGAKADRSSSDSASSKPASAASAYKAPPGQEAPADVAAPPADVMKTGGGTAYRVIGNGAGDRPEAEDTVALDYVAWTVDGRPFSSSQTTGRPAQVSLGGVVPGLSDALSEMIRGERRLVWIGADMSSADKWPNPPDGVPFTMDVTLVNIVRGAKAVPVPEDVAAIPSDAKKSKTGLAWKILQPGTGKTHPTANETVRVHYSGWTTDGKMFDSSEARRSPATFPLGAVIAGWTEGVQLMVEGEKRRFWIPVELAYNNSPGKPAGMLVFDIELIKILRPPAAPKDVAKPPSDASKTASGLASKVLVAGTGKDHPTEKSSVKVEYSGWTTDGKLFDSSLTRGQPATFALTGVIAGWTEGLQLMVVGEQRRFWIPEDLAYKGRRGKPKGMLVFDVELLEIQ